jgi:hypothetical protein
VAELWRWLVWWALGVAPVLVAESGSVRGGGAGVRLSDRDDGRPVASVVAGEGVRGAWF